MGSEICHINITNTGVSSDCENNSNHTKPRLITVNTKPLSVNALPPLSEGSKQKKDTLVKQMLTTVADCYHGKKDGYICTDPITIHVEKHEKCGACDVHIPVLEQRTKLARQYGIPIVLKKHDVSTKQGAHIYKKGMCSGTPCVVLEKPDGSYEHVAEGIDQDIGFFSSLFGIDNPLINTIGKKTIPLRVARKINL